MSKSVPSKDGAPRRGIHSRDAEMLFSFESQAPDRGPIVTIGSEVGGGERDRTDDLLLAKQALSQLSYAPDEWWAWEDLNFRPHAYQARALTN